MKKTQTTSSQSLSALEAQIAALTERFDDLVDRSATTVHPSSPAAQRQRIANAKFSRSVVALMNRRRAEFAEEERVAFEREKDEYAASPEAIGRPRHGSYGVGVNDVEFRFR